MFNLLHNYVPDSVFLKIGPLTIHWYGFLMVIGGLLGLFLVLYLVKKSNQQSTINNHLEKQFFYDLLLWFVVGAVIGARIYYIIYGWELYQGHWLDALKIWEGGLAVHGIMLGGFIGTWLFCRYKKKSFWQIADLVAIGLVTAQVIGRNGNYFNQEIFGKPTELPWGIPIDVLNRPEIFSNFTHFHSTFLYEVLGNLCILVVLLLVFRFLFLRRLKGAKGGGGWLNKRFHDEKHGSVISRLKKHSHSTYYGSARYGNVFLLYLVFYSIQRFLLEFLRVDYSPVVFGVRWAQLLSVLIIVGAGILFVWRLKKKRKDNGKTVERQF